MCNRLDLNTWDEDTDFYKQCGKLPVVDSYHYVCSERVSECNDERKAYHLFNYEWLDLPCTLVRKQKALLIEKELKMRDIFEVKYQLRKNLRHIIWENKLRCWRNDLNKSVEFRINWEVTYETIRNINYSKFLKVMDLEIRKNAEIAYQKFKELEEQRKRKEKEMVEMQDSEMDEEEIQYWHDFYAKVTPPEIVRLENFVMEHELKKYWYEDISKWLDVDYRLNW